MERLWAPWRLEYVQNADAQDGCVFCRAWEGDDEDGLVLHRGERAFALLNRFPYASGHLMVAPVRHGAQFDTLDRLPERPPQDVAARTDPIGGMIDELEKPNTIGTTGSVPVAAAAPAENNPHGAAVGGSRQ